MILNRQAHAWVEIYLDGIGWVPVEMTPGAAPFPHDNTGERGEEEVNQNGDAQKEPLLSDGVAQGSDEAADVPESDGALSGEEAGNRGSLLGKKSVRGCPFIRSRFSCCWICMACIVTGRRRNGMQIAESRRPEAGRHKKGTEMLVIELNRQNYEYDTQALVKAFFPAEQVEVLVPESRADKRERLSKEVKVRVIVGEEQAEVFVAPELCSRTYPDGGVACRDFPADGTGAGGGVTGADGIVAFDFRWESGDEKTCKEGFKGFFYGILSRITGRQLPWGMLTGIRPTKIAYGMLEEGRNRQEITEHYREKYFVSRRKAELAVDIAERERGLLSEVHYEDGYSLYIGIPFCPTTCLYCSFTSYPIASYRKQVDKYLDCLLQEAAFAAEQLRGKILDSVYIGGGTPTTLEPEQLERLLSRLREFYDFSTVQEFTVEAGRADSITEEKLRVLRRNGVTRISVNPQTMKQETLDLIGRKATVAQVEEAFLLARSSGFDNINMDIILGLPGETSRDVEHTIERLVELSPDSLTVHSLAVKRASGLNRWIQENGTAMLRNTDETMEIAAEGAGRLGMAPYYLYRQKNMSGNFENVGYAREGRYGLYNILIMEEVQTIVACGAGSISKRVYPDGRIERSENVKEVTQYLERIDEMIARKRRLLGDF